MKIGDWIDTPRFCKVKIKDIFDDIDKCYQAGYIEPTYYKGYDYEILGKIIGLNRMTFAAVQKGVRRNGK